MYAENATLCNPTLYTIIYNNILSVAFRVNGFRWRPRHRRPAVDIYTKNKYAAVVVL